MTLKIIRAKIIPNIHKQPEPKQLSNFSLSYFDKMFSEIKNPMNIEINCKIIKPEVKTAKIVKITDINTNQFLVAFPKNELNEINNMKKI